MSDSSSSESESVEGMPFSMHDLDITDLIFEESSFARGAFGRMVKADYFGATVCVKILKKQRKKELAKFVAREMAALKTLSHPNLIQFIGTTEKGNEICLVTEYISGGTLRKVLKDRSIPVPWYIRVQIAVDIASAMAYLHKRRIMHRDLKSKNLLVGDNWKVKICDFGFARSVHDKKKTAALTFCGTEEYMAPEVIFGMEYDERAEVYSYGLLLCEIITRQKVEETVPRTSNTNYGLDHQEFTTHVPEDCPVELLQLAFLCTEFEPKNRPDFREISQILREIKQTVVAATAPPTPARTAATPSHAPVTAPPQTPAPVPAKANTPPPPEVPIPLEPAAHVQQVMTHAPTPPPVLPIAQPVAQPTAQPASHPTAPSSTHVTTHTNTPNHANTTAPSPTVAASSQPTAHSPAHTIAHSPARAPSPALAFAHSPARAPSPALALSPPQQTQQTQYVLPPISLDEDVHYYNDERADKAPQIDSRFQNGNSQHGASSPPIPYRPVPPPLRRSPSAPVPMPVSGLKNVHSPKEFAKLGPKEPPRVQAKVAPPINAKIAGKSPALKPPAPGPAKPPAPGYKIDKDALPKAAPAIQRAASQSFAISATSPPSSSPPVPGPRAKPAIPSQSTQPMRALPPTKALPTTAAKPVPISSSNTPPKSGLPPSSPGAPKSGVPALPKLPPTSVSPSSSPRSNIVVSSKDRPSSPVVKPAPPRDVRPAK